MNIKHFRFITWTHFDIKMRLRDLLLHGVLLCAYLVVGKQLRGLNRSGFEFSCVQNTGISEGPVDNASIAVMKSWNINIVRVPLNEDCWLAINDHNPEYVGEKYRKAVIDYVDLLRKNNLTVILDLHWTDGLYGGPGQGECYDYTAKCQKPAPDKAHAPSFWKSVANTFKNDDNIIFELFNEPFLDQFITDKTKAWKCLRDGGKSCPGFQYKVAGTQDLLNAIRNTGAKNLVLVPGLAWTNDLSRWLEFVPKDPLDRIGAAWHSYNINACNNETCWDAHVAPVAAKYPVYGTETGEYDCSQNYVNKLMPWMDSKNINYLGWTWNTWDCAAGPALITSYDGTPTVYGEALKKHLAK